MAFEREGHLYISLLCIVAAVRLIGSLYIYSEAGGAAGRGGRPEGGWRAPGATQGQQLEESGERRAREGRSRPGAESLTKSFGIGPPIGRNNLHKTPTFDDPFSKMDKSPL